MMPIYDAAMSAAMAALILIGMAMGMQTEDE